MKKLSGFTLIELMIVVAIVGIVLSIVAGVGGGLTGNSTVSFGFNGMTEMRCIDGYRFTIGEGGHARQVLDEFGKGSKCQ